MDTPVFENAISDINVFYPNDSTAISSMFLITYIDNNQALLHFPTMGEKHVSKKFSKILLKTYGFVLVERENGERQLILINRNGEFQQVSWPKVNNVNIFEDYAVIDLLSSSGYALNQQVILKRQDLTYSKPFYMALECEALNVNTVCFGSVGYYADSFEAIVAKPNESDLKINGSMRIVINTDNSFSVIRMSDLELSQKYSYVYPFLTVNDKIYVKVGKRMQGPSYSIMRTSDFKCSDFFDYIEPLNPNYAVYNNSDGTNGFIRLSDLTVPK